MRWPSSSLSFFSLLAMFLQDILQEIWAADLFDQETGDATVWQRIYNGMQCVGMGVAGAFTATQFKKRQSVREAAGQATADEKMLPLDQGKRLLALGIALTVDRLPPSRLGFL